MRVNPRRLIALSLFTLLFVRPTYAAHGPAYLDPKNAGPDFLVQGEYVGQIGEKAKVGAQVIALGDGKFDAVLFSHGLPGAGWDGKSIVRLTGRTREGCATFEGKNFHGTIKDGLFAGTAEHGR